MTQHSVGRMPGRPSGNKKCVKTLTENDRGSHDPGDEHKTSHSWDDGAGQHVDERTACRVASHCKRRCEFGARRPDP